MAPQAVAIGVDIGGTSTKLGIVSLEGEILQRAAQPTPHHLPGEVLLASILEKLGGLVSWAEGQGLAPAGIGVSICGYLTPDGEEPDYINLHPLDHFPVVQRFRDTFGYPVVMDNDMNCGALGEYFFGGGRGANRLMVMTVGTGIGMGVILDGQVVRMSMGTTGNPGHTIVAPDGPVCVSGCRGCLESLASAGPISRLAEDLARSQRPTLLRDMLMKKGSLTPEDLYLAAEAGDLPAQQAWTEIGAWLGRGLATWVEIFVPEMVIVGGGVAQAGGWLVEPIEREMRRTGEPYFTRRVREVKPSRLGNEVAMLGAAAFYLHPETAPRWEKGTDAIGCSDCCLYQPMLDLQHPGGAVYALSQRAEGRVRGYAGSVNSTEVASGTCPPADWNEVVGRACAADLGAIDWTDSHPDPPAQPLTPTLSRWERELGAIPKGVGILFRLEVDNDCLE